MKGDTLLDDKIEYLKNLYEEENDRQKMVEGKCAQIVSNSGIFLSLIGLLITILFNTRDAMHPVVKIILAICITLIIVLYIISMINGLQGINPFKYYYARGSADTVKKFTDITKFKEEQVGDYLYCIQKNHELNTQKLDFLGKARTAFVRGIYTTGGLTFILMSYLTFFYITAPSKPQQIEIIAGGNKEQIKEISKSLSSIQLKTLGAADIKQIILLADSLSKRNKSK
ncbi:hypothetical protein [Mucilaginibacter sp. OK098]|uniref:hypothetical protein n=1 Tax=Mucilaginibacter sp. OK098 TaxID=1855297 RepID=UPI00092442E2|nr:hypothetical protein [Mucilaginibacter sp. OK098]SHM98632.1 hypothetical protein SAMN05216524_104426 [Mucilaginibacter sp. OK098]